jgi:hypothetical protein
MALSRAHRRLVLVTALALPLALACNGLIGLSDFDRVECTGGRCGDGGASFDATLVDGPDGALDAAPVDAAGMKPVSWAAWRMPNYDAGTDATDNPMSYSPTGDAVGVRDDVTSLVWRHPMPAEAASKTFDDAQKLCASLTPGSWRLPSRIELVTLLDLGQASSKPKIDPVFQSPAPGTSLSKYWTFSEVRSLPGVATDGRSYWVVDFLSGGVDKLPESAPAAVRCVKDGT